MMGLLGDSVFNADRTIAACIRLRAIHFLFLSSFHIDRWVRDPESERISQQLGGHNFSQEGPNLLYQALGISMWTRTWPGRYDCESTHKWRFGTFPSFPKLPNWPISWYYEMKAATTEVIQSKTASFLLVSCAKKARTTRHFCNQPLTSTWTCKSWIQQVMASIKQTALSTLSTPMLL